MSDEPRFTFLGKFLSFVLVAGLIGLGVYMLRQEGVLRLPGDSTPAADGAADEAGDGDAAAIAPVQVAVPKLSPPGPYVPKDSTIDVEISEYAGYAGLIAANGGLEPSENSVFWKNGGLKVRLTISEDESWSELNEGKIGASVTTVDVLAAYGRQFHAVVPAQIGFSRGADGLVVRSDVKLINDLRGKVVATELFI
jgi:NitT/TauT family transport system substrate-binding protein